MLLAIGLVASACSGDGGQASGEGGGSAVEPVAATSPADEATVAALQRALDGGPACDWLDTSECLFPFPSAHHEAGDRSSRTGVRLDLDPRAMPVNEAGVAVDPEPFGRNDGWGVGTPIMVSAPGIDPEASALPPEDDIARIEDVCGSAACTADPT